MKQFEFSHATVEIRKGVVWLTFKESAELDVKEIRELTKAAETLSENKPYVLMVDARVHLTITSEARKISAEKKESPLLLANAVIVNNLPVRVTANFFSSFNKPHFAFKVFNDEKKALTWLLKQKP